MSDPQILIRLVEDQAIVRLLPHEDLESAGYEAIEVDSAPAALAVLGSRPGVGLLFTDINIPDPMDGLQLAELVHARWPAVRLVAIGSRGPHDPVPDDGRFSPKSTTPGELPRATRASVVPAKGQSVRRPMRRPRPAFEGDGHLSGSGFAGEVRYAIHGDPAALRPGRPAVRAALSGAPELVEEAFRAGSGTLTLPGGLQLRLKMLAHTQLGHEVFVEAFA